MSAEPPASLWSRLLTEVSIVNTRGEIGMRETTSLFVLESCARHDNGLCKCRASLGQVISTTG